MKREIKFRAWLKNNTMQYNIVPFQWDYVIDTMLHKCIASNGLGVLGSGGTEASFEVNGFAFKELMQYAGLKDKNGKEIYEGDILQSGETKFPIEVKFHNGGFICKRKTTQSAIGYYQLSKIEVIGNIYENPELLNPPIK